MIKNAALISIIKRLVLTISVLFLSFFATNIASASTWNVDTNLATDPNTCVADEADNDDDCTLSDAISQATAGDSILFLEDLTISLTGIETISANNITLDGTGFTIDITGNGFLVSGDNVTIQNLNIYGAVSGITINSTADSTTIDSNIFGIDGVTPSSNSINLSISGTNTVISNNVISAGTNDGIVLNAGAKDITITGNKIGTDSVGTTDRGNTLSGINVSGNGGTVNLNGGDGGVEGLVIGGSLLAERNVISGNTSNGITIGSSVNTITGTITIRNNFIGVDTSGSTAMANDLSGIYGDETTSGVTYVIDANTISSNSSYGIYLEDGTSADITSNYIGVTSSGVDGTNMGNAQDGISVDAVTTTITSNVIGNNAGTAILADGTDLTSITVNSNKLGVDTSGTANVGNSSHGVSVDAASATTITIGGDNTSDRNISGFNTGFGFSIGSNVDASAVVTIKNNYIGVGSDGTTVNTDAGNGFGGIEISKGATVNIIDNVISANDSGGISISGGIAITIQGNVIGAACASAPCTSIDSFLTSMGNTANGILVNSASITSLTIGGATSSLSNVITANGDEGIDIQTLAASTTPVTIKGNFVGVAADFTTTTNMGNGSDPSENGINISYGAITLGGNNNLGNLAPVDDTLAEGNLISNNTGNGVAFGNNVDSADVFGNIIGLKHDVNSVFNTAAANAVNGIAVSSTSINTLNIGEADGTTVVTKRNLISANTADGISISTTAADADVNILNNYIGTDATGDVDLGNGGDGIQSSANATVDIGGIAANEGNVISGNTVDGIKLSTSGTITILANKIGLNTGGDTAIANDEIGINISGGTVTIGNGATTGRNIISGNLYSGIETSGGTITVLGNFIGTNINGTAAIGNGASALGALVNRGGIYIAGGTTTIGGTNTAIDTLTNGNLISGNYGQGLLVIAGSAPNIIGNYIGTDLNGDAALANVNGTASYNLLSNGNDDDQDAFNGSGIIMLDMIGNSILNPVIGGATTASGNVIAANEGSGIVVVHFKNVFPGAGSGQTWTSGSIQSNYIGIASDGATVLSNTNDDSSISYEVYVNENSGTITAFDIGDATSKNIINNDTHVGVFLEDIAASNLTNRGSIADNNTWTSTVCDVTYNYIEHYIDGSLVYSAPTCSVTPSVSTASGGGGRTGSITTNQTNQNPNTPTDTYQAPTIDLNQYMTEESNGKITLTHTSLGVQPEYEQIEESSICYRAPGYISGYAYADSILNESTFNETYKKHWAFEIINNLYKKSFINNLYEPNEYLSRREAINMTMNAFNLQTEENNTSSMSFLDFNANDKDYENINKAYKCGIIHGDLENHLRLEDPISRAEVLKIIARAAGYLSLVDKINYNTKFTDFDTTSWFSKTIYFAEKYGIVTGFEDGTFKPANNVTRSEFAKMINMMLEQKL